MAYTPDFELVHIGVNCADEAQAAECAHKFELLFQLAVNPAKESADARFSFTQCQALVRFFALRRIKPHTPPLVRAPVNSFEFQSCDRSPQAGYLLR